MFFKHKMIKLNKYKIKKFKKLIKLKYKHIKLKKNYQIFKSYVKN